MLNRLEGYMVPSRGGHHHTRSSMTQSFAILERLLSQARRRRPAGPGPAVGAVPQLPPGAGPIADPAAVASPARCLRPGPGNVPESTPRVRPVRRLGRAGTGRLAPPDSGSDPGEPGQASSCPGTRSAPPGITGRAPRPLEPGNPANWRTRSPRRVRSPCVASRPSCSPMAVRLPADYREVFILRNLEHVAVDEIAMRMGRSPNAVRKLWGRAMIALKQAME